MMKNLLIERMSAEELQARIESIIEKYLTLLKQQESDSELDILTREETATLLNVSLPTLNTWAKKGELVPFRIGNRIYYNQKDIVASKKYLKSH